MQVKATRASSVGIGVSGPHSRKSPRHHAAASAAAVQKRARFAVVRRSGAITAKPFACKAQKATQLGGPDGGGREEAGGETSNVLSTCLDLMDLHAETWKLVVWKLVFSKNANFP